MLPHETARRASSLHLEIDLWLDPALFWFRGHFSTHPLLPGVAQLDWVMRYALAELAPGYRFRRIQVVKFQAPLLPDEHVTLRLDWDPQRELLSFSYQQQRTASSGKIVLCR